MAERGSDPVCYQGVVECDGCDGIRDVNNYCIDCPGNVCDKCKPTHCNTKLTKSHKVLPRTHPEVQRARRSRKVYCQQHHDVEYVTFCIKCQVPCCPRCIASGHSGHEFSELFDEISKVEKELVEIALDLESSQIPEAKKTLDQINHAISEFNERGEEIKKSVKEGIKEVHKDVDQIGEGVLTALENQRIKDIQQMQVTKKTISDNIVEMARRAETCRSAPADASLLLLKNKFRYLEPKQMYSVELPGRMAFEKTTSKLPSSSDLIGRIVTGRIVNINMTRKSDISCNLVPLIEKRIEMKVLRTLEKKRGDAILHMMNGETWISDEAAQTISIFGEQYNQIKEINLDFSCRDMALTQKEEILATDYINDSIMRISSSGSITTLCSKDKVTPNGICVNNKQQIVVGGGVVVEGVVHNMLVVYSSYGSSVLQEIEYDHFRKPLFTGRINRVRQTMNGYYVVADGARVICLSDEWNVKWQYDVGLYVYGLCCDKYNNILIADRDNNQIIMLGSEGQLIKKLLTKSGGIKEPISLSVDSSGHLWIGQNENTLVLQNAKQ